VGVGQELLQTVAEDMYHSPHPLKNSQYKGIDIGQQSREKMRLQLLKTRLQAPNPAAKASEQIFLGSKNVLDKGLKGKFKFRKAKCDRKTEARHATEDNKSNPMQGGSFVCFRIH
jgi:hypothetical protein